MKEANLQCFVDSNIWLYCLGNQPSEPKFAISQSLINENDVFISVQVVNEVCFNLKRKFRFTEVDIEGSINYLYSFHVINLSKDIILKACELRKKHQFSFWNGLIVSSGLFSGASVLYSEDMQDGLVIENKLRIVNPFRL